MSLGVRRASREDISSIVEIWIDFMDVLQRTNPDYWQLDNGSATFTRYLEAALTNGDVLVAVAEKDARVIGFTLAGIETLPEWFRAGRVGLIRYLAVAEDSQGTGAGSQLVAFVKDWLRAFGVMRVELYVLKGLPASDFWARLGFREFLDRRFLEL